MRTIHSCGLPALNAVLGHSPQLLPSLREKLEFLRMSLMELPRHASDLRLRTQHKENFMKLNSLKSRVTAGVNMTVPRFVIIPIKRQGNGHDSEFTNVFVPFAKNP